MKWTADPSCYKAATSPLAKCSTRRVKHLSTDFVPDVRIGCGTEGLRRAASAPCYIAAG
jgi:hypothetical protein